VLEGGIQMITPQPGSMGYQRLMCGDWPLYQPKSELVRELHAGLWSGAGSPTEN
jgi:hypothetical protein